MQRGTVVRHGRGWRGRWREHGRIRSTATYGTKDAAKAALVDALARMERGERFRPLPPDPTFRELATRWLAQYAAPSPKTHLCARGRLVRPLAAFGDARAGDLTTETLQVFLNTLPPERVGAAYRRDIMRTLRAVFAWGVEAGLVAKDPAKRLKAPRPIRSERIVVFESWAEVDAVAALCGSWAPLVTFAVDVGARPSELQALEWRDVDLRAGTVTIRGTKTERSRRLVYLTDRGRAALACLPRALATDRMFTVEGRPISWPYFARAVWRPALERAGLAHRTFYCTRHTFAYFSLRAGVPISDVARDMGHTDVTRTFQVYGHWAREQGAGAAVLRQAWAAAERQAEAVTT